VRLGLDLAPLRSSRDFRLVFAGAGLSAIGSYLTYISIPYQVYLLTHDPLLVGLLGLCEIVPLLFMAFIGGTLADYVDRRRLMILGELAFTALTWVLLVNALLGQPQLWIMFVGGCADDRDRRTSTACTGRNRAAAGRTDAAPSRKRAHTLRMNVASLAGPAFGGVLLATLPLAWLYAIDLCTFVAAFLRYDGRDGLDERFLTRRTASRLDHDL
jgi:MFS family permease